MIDSLQCLTPGSWPVVTFFVMGAAMALAVARFNRFGPVDTLKALIGLRSFKRSRLINLLNAAVLLGPIGLFYWTLQTCDASQGVL